MKQRLLLALLMLLTSAGFMKVDGQTIVLPKSETGEKVTLTFTGTFSASSYPIVYGTAKTSGNEVKIVGTPGTTAVYELASSVKQDTTYVLNNAYLAEWGEIEVTLDGKVLKFETSSNSNQISPKFSSLVFLNNDTLISLNLEQASGLKKLDISGNDDLTSITNLGGAVNLESLKASGCGFTSLDLTTNLSKLETLDLSGNQIISLGNLPKSIKSLDISNNGYAGEKGVWDLSTYTNLKKLNIDGNKLNTVKVSDDLLKSSDFIKGIQDFTVIKDLFSNKKANENTDIATASTKINIGTDKFVSAESWKKFNDKTQKYDIDATSEAHTIIPDNNVVYRFFDANNVYVDGDYECVLVSENGFRYRVQFTVKPAVVALTRAELDPKEIKIKAENSAHVDIFADYGNSVQINQGEVLKISVLLEGSNYELETFELKGLELMDNSSLTENGITCKVAAKYIHPTEDELPFINAKLKGVNCVVKYNTPNPEQGFVEVFKQDADNNYTVKVKSGETLAYNTKIRVVVTTKEGNASLAINGKDCPLTPMPDKSQKYADYTVQGETTITASFGNVTAISVGALVNGKGLSDPAVAVTNLSVTITGEGLTTNNVLNTTNSRLALVPGREYQLQTQIGHGATVIDAILLNGAPVKDFISTVEGSNDVYRASFTAPATDADLCIVSSKLETIEIIPTNVSGKIQTVVYDKSIKSFEFKTNPEGLENSIKVSYQLEGGTKWETNPTTAGTYKVRLIREAGNGYIDLRNEEYSLVVKKAKPTFAQVPTVTIVDGKYQISGDNVDGVEGRYDITEPTTVNTTDSHVVKFSFEPTVDTNYESVDFAYAINVPGKEPKKEQTVSYYTADNDLKVEMLVSGAVKTESGNKFVEGTKLTFLVTYPQGVPADKVKASLATTTKATSPLSGGEAYSTFVKAYTYTVQPSTQGEQISFTIDESAKLTKGYEISLDKESYVTSYEGNPLTLADFDANLKITPENNDVVLSFKDEAGNKIAGYPVNKGKYTLCVSVPAGNGYQAKTIDLPNVFDVKKAIPEIISWPTSACPISNGQTLEFALLEGGQSSMVAGHFEFVNISDKPQDGDKCKIHFVPFDTDNYESVEPETAQYVTVIVIDQPLLTISAPKYGRVKVVDAETGTEYHSGDPIAEGTKLTISATAYDHFKFSKFVVNGSSLTSNPASYTVGNSVVEVSAEFSYVEEEPEIDENSRYTVNVTKVLRGAVIDKPGANSVKRGESFSFSVATLAADASKVVVKVDGVTIKPVSGKYTITDITENKEVSVTLANPTPIKVTVPTEYKNKGGYLMGRVKISGPSDGKYYYNDQITLVAFPESGVHFDGWTGDLTGLTQIKEVVLTKDLTAGAKFSGTPTGIEDIMAASITTGKGCVWVRGIANADVTIVSIAGRVQAQERISGDTRIDVPAGIYVVVLESGSDVKRVKVIVK